LNSGKKAELPGCLFAHFIREGLMNVRIALPVVVLVLFSSSATAQTPGGNSVAGDLTVGYAGFVDEGMIHHGVVGGALRWYVSPRVSLGPEIVFMAGPGDDRDLMLTGNLTFDFLSPGPGRVFTPFVVAGGGWFRHSDRVGAGSYASDEGAFTAGVGLRANVSDRWYVGAEWRVGWELHTRISGVVGFRIP
jgi:hypothetical protein